MVKNMNSNIKTEEIARLDGYLSGLAAYKGGLREYSAYSYLLDLTDQDITVETALKSHFESQKELDFLSVERLPNGLRDVEIDIQPFLAINSRNIDIKEISEMRNYFSFRIMDIVSLILGEDKDVCVYKLVSAPGTPETENIFFCIRAKNYILVVQFLCNIGFLKDIYENKSFQW